MAWPTEPPRQRGYRFLGYALDSQGRPTFRYRTPDASVDDKLIPVAGELAGAFRREIRIKPNDDFGSDGTLYFRAASGDLVSAEDGWYVIDGVVKVRIQSTGAREFTRELNSASEVLVPIQGPTKITQEIVW